MKEVDFDKLVTTRCMLRMPRGGMLEYQFQLGTVIFQAIEDENDGYRSAMDGVEIITMEATDATDIEEVIVIREENDGGFDGYELMTDDGHTYLRFGTDYSDSYYPTFIFDYIPR